MLSFYRRLGGQAPTPGKLDSLALAGRSLCVLVRESSLTNFLPRKEIPMSTPTHDVASQGASARENAPPAHSVQDLQKHIDCQERFISLFALFTTMTIEPDLQY